VREEGGREGRWGRWPRRRAERESLQRARAPPGRRRPPNAPQHTRPAQRPPSSSSSSSRPAPSPPCPPKPPNQNPPNLDKRPTEASSTHPGADRAFFTRRELCFTLEGDIFARYQSFPDAQAWARACRQRVPTKIDVGPVYTHNPRDRAKYGRDFRPVERELVFDVDLTDYDDVRTCGSGGHICARCWPFMACAIETMDAALRRDFGFRHVLWAFSGRRGVHGWVCDAGARGLADEVRAALVGFCSVYRGTEAGGEAAGAEGGAPPAFARARLATGASRHPSVERAYVTLRRAWETRVLPAQGLLDGPETWGRVLQYIPDEESRRALERAWAAGRLLHGGGGAGGGGAGGSKGGAASSSSSCLSVSRWFDLVAEVERAAARAARGAAGAGAAAAAATGGQKQQQQPPQGPRQRAAALNRAVPDIVLAFTYPRLDVEVSKKMNHLLKAPFCVHPKTGRVCVPLDAARVWEFDPEATEAPRSGGGGGGKGSGSGGGSSSGSGDFAPRVTDLLAQAALAQQQGRTGGGPGQVWRETALAPSLRLFEDRFLAPLGADARAALTAGSKDRAAAAAAAAGGGAAAPAGLAW